MTRIVLLLIMLLASLFSTPRASAADPTACTTFEDFYGRALGDTVALCGYLDYTADQANVYMDKDHTKLVDLTRCVPVAIRRAQQELHSNALQLSSRLVRVQGIKSRLCDASSICPAWCGEVGIVADQIAAQ